MVSKPHAVLKNRWKHCGAVELWGFRLRYAGEYVCQLENRSDPFVPRRTEPPAHDPHRLNNSVGFACITHDA